MALTEKQKGYLVQSYTDIISSLSELKYCLNHDVYIDKEATIEDFLCGLQEIITRNIDLVHTKMELDKIAESNKK